jgi:hypothetical protein
MIHGATVVDKGRKDSKKKMELKKVVVQYSKFLKGLHIRSEVKLDTFVNSAFRFTKVLLLEILFSYLLLEYLQFMKSLAQEHKQQCQTVSKNILWG